MYQLGRGLLRRSLTCFTPDDEAIERDMSRQPVAKAQSGPEPPAMFARYKTRVEDEFSRSALGSDSVGVYILLRYHMGWVDRWGNRAGSPISQGKALRPTLCLFACEALSQDFTRAMAAAAALELIHNFSLIHDDIQDQDHERRHQPTAWRVWGVSKALVAGNAMQCAGDLALLSSDYRDPSAEIPVRVSQLLTDNYLEMIEGQCLDLSFESRTVITTEEYLDMIGRKTGALIRSGLEIGALAATRDPAAFQAFSRFGDCLGRAFQIRDDFLGIWGDESATGKATGNDIRRRKKSFPVVFALNHASHRSRSDLSEIYSKPDLDEDDVARVMSILDEAGAREQSQNIIDDNAADALSALDQVSLPAWARDEAEGLVDYLARRES